MSPSSRPGLCVCGYQSSCRSVWRHMRACPEVSALVRREGHRALFDPDKLWEKAKLAGRLPGVYVHEAVPPLSAEEASALEDALPRERECEVQNIVRFHDGRGWAALDYPSWQAWVHARYPRSKRHANRLIKSVRVVEVLRQAGVDVSRLPERVLRELGRLPPADLPDFVRTLREDCQRRGIEMTWSVVREAVREEIEAPGRERAPAAARDLAQATKLLKAVEISDDLGYNEYYWKLSLKKNRPTVAWNEVRWVRYGRR